MGFFDFLKKTPEAAPAAPAFPMMLAADAKGTVVPMEQIPDEVFAQGILGKCCGIDPAEGRVYAPVDGTITQAPDSGHALGIQGAGGVEVLIHVGIDTVQLEGKHYDVKVEAGQKVRKGDLLLVCDRAAIEKEGYQTVTPMIISNTADFADVQMIGSGEVKKGTPVLRVE